MLLVGGAAIIAGTWMIAGPAGSSAQSVPASPPGQTQLDRTVLPIAEPKYPHSTILDARNATPPPRFQVAAPAGAPNV